MLVGNKNSLWKKTEITNEIPVELGIPFIWYDISDVETLTIDVTDYIQKVLDKSGNGLNLLPLNTSANSL